MPVTLSGRYPKHGGAPRRDRIAVGAAVADVALRLLAERGGVEEFPVVGHSMHPIFDGVERVRVRLRATALRFGEVVLFLRGDGLVVHRVVGHAAGGYRTRGDGQKGFDARLVQESDVIGVVTQLRWPGSEVDLEGPGAPILRWLLGAASLMAGRLGLAPAGARPGATLLGRARDASLAPLYRGLLRGAFRAYASVSRRLPGAPAPHPGEMRD